jgi:hypothetical protein
MQKICPQFPYPAAREREGPARGAGRVRALTRLAARATLSRIAAEG